MNGDIPYSSMLLNGLPHAAQLYHRAQRFAKKWEEISGPFTDPAGGYGFFADGPVRIGEFTLDSQFDHDIIFLMKPLEK